MAAVDNSQAATNLESGRVKSEQKSQKRDKQVKVLLTEDEMQELIKSSQKDGIDRSSYVRSLILKNLRDKRNETEHPKKTNNQEATHSDNGHMSAKIKREEIIDSTKNLSSILADLKEGYSLQLNLSRLSNLERIYTLSYLAGGSYLQNSKITLSDDFCLITSDKIDIPMEQNTLIEPKELNINTLAQLVCSTPKIEKEDPDSASSESIKKRNNIFENSFDKANFSE